MFNRIVKITLVALAMIGILPTAVNAQKSAGIRVGARVVRSVLPETQMTAEIVLQNVAQVGMVRETISSHSVSTANGIAQVYTERLAGDVTQVSNRSATSREGVDAVRQDCIRLTVAYTAN